MKKNWLAVLIMTAFLLILLVPITLAQPDTPESELFSVRVGAEGHNEQIGCWKSKTGEYYVFLPAYADVSTAVFELHTEGDLYIDGEKINNGKTLDEYDLNKKYDFKFNHYGKEQTADLIFMKSENIAAMYIDTESGNMDYIHSQKGNNEKGKASVYTASGRVDATGDIESLSGRGNTTWEKYDKKAYSLDFLTDVDLLGMGAAKRWVLFANAGDPSNLRNKIAYDFAKSIGLGYSPDSRWVDLYLNGEYAGVYLLSERNEVYENRVEISNVSGALLSWESEDRLNSSGHKYILTENGKPYRLHYPKTASAEVLNSIKNKVQSLENALFSEDGIDPVSKKSWLSMVDLDSWVKKYLIDEAFGNLDGYIFSQYCYYDDDGLLYCGPVWDYDHAFGEDMDEFWSITNPDTFVVGRYPNYSLDMGYTAAFLNKKEFTDRAKELYENEFSSQVNDFLHVKIPEYIKQTKAAYEMNKIRWFEGMDIGDLESEADLILDYVTNHGKFLKSAWLEGEEYCKITITKSSNDRFYCVKKGETLNEMPKIENTDWGIFDGLYYIDSGEPFDISKPITEDIELCAKWIDSDNNKLGDVIKLAPLGVFGLILLAMFGVAVWQIKKSR